MAWLQQSFKLGSAFAAGCVIGEVPWRLPKKPKVLATQGTAGIWAPCLAILGLWSGVQNKKTTASLLLGASVSGVSRALLARGWKQVPWSYTAPLLDKPPLTSLRVLAINMNAENTKPALGAQYITIEDPHIVLACECTPENEKALTTTLGQPVARGGVGGCTTLIYAPGLNPQELVAAPAIQCVARSFAHATMETLAGRLHFVSVHLSAPRYEVGLEEWQEQHTQLTHWVKMHKESLLVVGGDFNTSTLFSVANRYRAAGLKDAARERGNGLLRTWGPRGLFTILNLDHILVRGLRVKHTRSVRIPGSDHDAVLTELML